MFIRHIFCRLCAYIISQYKINMTSKENIMRKQWTISLALLTLSVAFVGCGNKDTTNAPENTTIIEETTENLEETTIESVEEVNDTEETESNVTETPENASENKEDLKLETTSENKENEKTEATSENKENEKTEATSESLKNDTSNGSTEKPAQSSKPNNTASSNTSSKPNSGSNTATKPQASPKPNTSTGTSNKPQTAPSTKPESVPSTKPESAPVTKPEVTPAPTPEEKPEESKPSLSCSSIYSQITAGLDLSSQLEMDAALLKDYYGIDTSLLEDFCVQVPMLSFSITEIGVFKVKDASNVSQIVSAINSRANDIGIMLYPSLEETYNNRQIVTKGNYILFAISDDVNQIVSKFNTLV